MIKRGYITVTILIVFCLLVTTAFATANSQEQIVESLISQRTDILNLYYAGEADKKETMENISNVTTDFLKESDLKNLEAYFQCDLERPIGYEFSEIDVTYYDDEVICALVTIEWMAEGIKGREDFSHTYSVICVKEENLYKLAQFF